MCALFRKKKDLAHWNGELLKLEQIREKILRDIERLEAAKAEYFDLGRREASFPRKVVLADKIKQMDFAVKAHNDRIVKINKQIEFVNQVILKKVSEGDVRIKEFEPTLREIEQVYDKERIWGDKFETARLEIDTVISKSDSITLDPQTQEILNLFETTAGLGDKTPESGPSEKEIN